MTNEKEKQDNDEPGIGVVSLTGEVGIGMKMPDGNVVELNNVDVGTAQVLAYLVKNVSEIRKNI